MENWLGLHEVAPLEPKPGVPPSSGYLAQVLQKLQATPAKFAIRAAYEDDRPSIFISEHADIPAVVLALHGRRHRRGERSFQPL